MKTPEYVYYTETSEIISDYQNYWKIQEQEISGNMKFDGTCGITANVDEALSMEEKIQIHSSLRKRVLAENGIEYMVIFKDENQRTIYCIDYGETWFMLFSWEY